MKSSPYYPPRAGALSRFTARVNRWRGEIRLRTSYEARYRVVARTAGEEMLWLLVPGLMWKRQGRRALGSQVLAGWLVLLMVQIAVVNPAAARIAGILCCTIHAVSAAAVIAVIFPYWSRRAQLWRTPPLVMALMFLIYSVAFRMAVEPFARRASTGERTTMTHAFVPFSQKSLERGDWVIYQMDNGRTNFDRILAGPGDFVRFEKEFFEVNGRRFERPSPSMPVTGEFTVQSECYFIWPTGASYTHAEGGESQLLFDRSHIPASDIQGEAYRNWLGRRQVLEDLKQLPSPRVSP